MQLDPVAAAQIRETRQTVLGYLARDPADFKALVLAEVVADIDPDGDPALRGHADRGRALRARDADGWARRAREHGLDVVLFNLCEGMHGAAIGAAAVPVLAGHAAAFSERPVVLALLRDLMRKLGHGAVADTIEAAIATRAPRLAEGQVDASFVPEALATSRRATIAYHPSGHLASVVVSSRRRNRGELELAARPGSGRLYIENTCGGHGYSISERYRRGAVHSTYCSPWHDGEEASARLPWTRWVAEALKSLEAIACTRR